MDELTTTHFITLRFIGYKRPVRGDEVIYNLEVDRFIEKLTVAIKGARHWKRYKRKCLIPGYCQIEFGKLHDFPHAHIAIQKPEWLPEAKFVNAIHAEARRLEWLKSDADAVHEPFQAISPNHDQRIESSPCPPFIGLDHELA